RYAYGTIYGFKRDDGTFLPFWQASEATMRTLVGRDLAAEPQEAGEVFRQHWQTHGDQSGPFAPLYEHHGLEIAGGVQSQLQEEQAGDWQLRQNLEVDLAGHRVEVTIDRIETSGEEEQPTKFVRTRYGKSKSKPAPGMRELLYVHASRQHRAGEQVVLQMH